MLLNTSLADGTQYSTIGGVYQAFADYLAQVKLTHPQCFVTQAEFDADIASTGQCGRYVLDTVNFRVPKITRFIGATVNLADIGKAWGRELVILRVDITTLVKVILQMKHLQYILESKEISGLGLVQ